jgi:hypothetical protein
MKGIIKLIFAFLPVILVAQPKIKNAEKFSMGTVLKFMKCNADSVMPGKSGAKQIWDFTSLISLKDTMTETMVDPASTPDGDLFINATLAEKYSDGRYVYADIRENQNFLMGFADSRNKILIKYPNPMLFAQRPLTYGTVLTDQFTDEFMANNFEFEGSGSMVLKADGYGTLILPNGKYNNVLRVKITQNQVDTMTRFNQISKTTSTTYVWFDENHTSALLKIDQIESKMFNRKSVYYLLSETKPEIKK